MLQRIYDDIGAVVMKYGREPERIELGHKQWNTVLRDAYERNIRLGEKLGEDQTIFGVPVERSMKGDLYRVIVTEEIGRAGGEILLRRLHGTGYETVQILAVNEMGEL